jgi:hypothetical protein
VIITLAVFFEPRLFPANERPFLDDCEFNLSVSKFTSGVPEGERAAPGKEYIGTVAFKNTSRNISETYKARAKSRSLAGI